MRGGEGRLSMGWRVPGAVQASRAAAGPDVDAGAASEPVPGSEEGGRRRRFPPKRDSPAARSVSWS